MGTIRGARTIAAVAGLLFGVLVWPAPHSDAAPAAMAPVARVDVATATSTNFGAIVVDSTNKRAYLSFPQANVVDVVSYDGHIDHQLGEVYGAAGMVLVGSTLYVAESTAGSVDAIDLTTGKHRILASGINQPYWIAYTAGRLWVTVAGSSSASIDAINVTTGKVTAFPSLGFYAPDLATSPGAPDTLFVAEDGLSPGAVYRLSITKGVPRIAAVNNDTEQENIEQLAVSPSGTRAIPASGYPYEFPELSAKTLQPDGIIYPGAPYPSAVAVSAGKGGLLATGLDNGYSEPDIAVDVLGTPAAFATFSTGSSSTTANVVPHGLALNATGTELFAVTGSSTDGYTISVFSVPSSKQ